MHSAEPQKTAIVVSHTHWDRAWYLTFQQFRHRMVRMIDRLIDMLDNNPEYHSFTLDGQTILLEDYLEIRPERKSDLKRLISTGRMIVGPWYILPDLFLVSGESVIRNLQIGLRSSREYGSPMQVGYVPDPFGHFAQLPQILRGFGIDSFIFMRGLGCEEKSRTGTLFNWQSPDGSTVLATYLVDGYFNGAALGYPEQFGRFDGLQPDPELARKRANEAIEKLEKLQKEHVFLVNNGFDHMPEQPDLPEILANINATGQINGHLRTSVSSAHAEKTEELNIGQELASAPFDVAESSTQFIHGTFQHFFEAVKACGFDHHTLTGDLLGNADHPILSSVFSTRIYLKQQNHRAQSLLERYVEPLTATTGVLFPRPSANAFTEYAWKLLLQNHPHDDICGCSADGVHEDDEVRFRQVTELAESLMTEQLENLMHAGLRPPAVTGQKSSDIFLWNPHPWSHECAVTTSILFANPKAEQGDRTPQRRLRAIDAGGNEVSVEVLSSVEHDIRNNFLETSWGRRYTIRLNVEMPAFGYQVVHVFETDEIAKKPVKNGRESVVNVNSNGAHETRQTTSEPFILKTAGTELRALDGRYSVHFSETGVRFRDFLRFEFQQDNGDTYTFGPVPETGAIWSDAGTAAIDPNQPDSLIVTHELQVPGELNSSSLVTLQLTTQIILQPDGTLSFRTQYHNSVKNGRLRVVLPTGMINDEVLADGHFRLAKRAKVRTNTPESAPERYRTYPGELEYPTQHMNDFVLAEGEVFTTWLASRGLHEFELVDMDDISHIALTVNRSVGHLSTANGRIRRVQAGPAIAVPGAQCLREITADFAWGSVMRSQRGTAMRRARAFSHPVWVREMPWLPHLKSTGDVPRRHMGLKISHPDVHISCFRIQEDTRIVVLRIYSTNDSSIETEVSIGLPVNAMARADLNEVWPSDPASIIPCGSQFTLSLNPGEIATVLLRLQE